MNYKIMFVDLYKGFFMEKMTHIRQILKIYDKFQ
jgi:hypothetical protein